MAVTAAQIIAPTTLTTGIVTLYTVAANTTLQVRKLTVTNPTSTAKNFSLYLTNSAQPTDDTTVLVKTKVVSPLATVEVFVAEGVVLPAAAKIAAVSDVAGMVIQASGMLVQ